MKMKIIIMLGLVCILSFACISMGVSAEVNIGEIREKQLEFASRYLYKKGDVEKTFSLHSTELYTSGIEYTEEGKEYECPAIYIDSSDLSEDKYSLEMKKMDFTVNNISKTSSEYYTLYKSRILVPVSMFSELECNVIENRNTYVTTIIKNNTILEIIPYMIGMRIDQSDGYYIPLVPCARIINDVLYVPLRAVAEELGFDVDWDDAANTATVSNSQIAAIIETSNN